ncbi:MAG: hypothetical protein JXR49_09740 [Acidobacteria bacterium]|nr:hypothetical protein [Acidobacteriota bacterium]
MTKGFVVLILIFPFLSFASDSLPSIENSDCYIGSISLNDSYEDVIKILGTPLRENRHKNEVTGGEGIEIKYKGMALYILDNDIVTIEVTGGLYKMPNGIGIGSDQELVLKLLGESELEETDKNISVFYVIKTPNGEFSDAFLKIEFTDKKVTKIIMQFPYV